MSGLRRGPRGSHRGQRQDQGQEVRTTEFRKDPPRTRGGRGSRSARRVGSLEGMTSPGRQGAGGPVLRHERSPGQNARDLAEGRNLRAARH
jgi:predicted secreted protein